MIAGSVLFLLYGAGMGLVVGAAALSVAVAQQLLVRGAGRLGRDVPAAVQQARANAVASLGAGGVFLALAALVLLVTGAAVVRRHAKHERADEPAGVR